MIHQLNCSCEEATSLRYLIIIYCKVSHFLRINSITLLQYYNIYEVQFNIIDSSV